MEQGGPSRRSVHERATATSVRWPEDIKRAVVDKARADREAEGHGGEAQEATGAGEPAGA